MTFPELLKTLDDHVAASQELIHSFAELEQHQAGSQQSISQLDGEFAEFHQIDPKPALDPLVSALHSLTADLDQHAHSLTDAATALSHEAQSAGAAIQQAVTAFDTEHQKALSDMHALDTELQADSHTAADLSTRMNQAAAKLDSTIQQGDHAAGQLHDQSTAALAQLSAKVSGEFSQTTASDFSHAGDTIGHQEGAHLEQGYRSAEQMVAHAYDALNHGSQQASQTMEAAGQHIFEALIDEIIHKAVESALDEFKDLVDHAAEDVAHQIEEYMFTMITGEEVTAVLTPILPELKAAERATEALAHLMEG